MNKNYLLIFLSLLLLRSAFALDNPQRTIRASCVQEATAEPFAREVRPAFFPCDTMSSVISAHLAKAPEILLECNELQDETKAHIIIDLLNILPSISEALVNRGFLLINSPDVENETKANMFRIFLECKKISPYKHRLAATHLFESRLLNNTDIDSDTKALTIANILNCVRLSEFHHSAATCLFEEKLFDSINTTKETIALAVLSILRSDKLPYFLDAANYLLESRLLSNIDIHDNTKARISTTILSRHKLSEFHCCTTGCNIPLIKFFKKGGAEAKTQAIVIANILSTDELSEFHYTSAKYLFEKGVLIHDKDVTKPIKTLTISSILKRKELCDFHYSSAKYLFKEKLFNHPTITDKTKCSAVRSILISHDLSYFHDAANYLLVHKLLIRANKAALSAAKIIENDELLPNFDDAAYYQLGNKILISADIAALILTKIIENDELLPNFYDYIVSLSQQILACKTLDPNREALLYSLVMALITDHNTN